ncbi:hypothetical protein SprV_0200695800 [Sparganum proliferum]
MAHLVCSGHQSDTKQTILVTCDSLTRFLHHGGTCDGRGSGPSVGQPNVELTEGVNLNPLTALVQVETVKSVSQRIDSTVFFGSTGSGRTFYVCDTATRRRFLVDTGAQISVVPPTPADLRFPSPDLHLQAANCSPIPTFGSLSFTLITGFRRSCTWIFVIADVPHAILGSDFLAEFDLLVDCRRARLLDRTTGLSARGLTPFTVPTNVSVLDTDISSPFRELRLRHPNSFAEVRSNMMLCIISAPQVLPCFLGRDD